MAMTGPEVMLCSIDRTEPAVLVERLTGSGDWWFELKYDGIRAVVVRSGDSVTIWNRRQMDITHRYPDVVAAMLVGEWNGTLDGEIIVQDGQGRPDFALAHLRDAQSSPRGVRAARMKAPARFMPFDVLRLDGRDMRNLPYVARTARLTDSLAGLPHSAFLTSQDGPTMWAFVQDWGIEGLVAKKADSLYRAGRHNSWVKIKSTKRLSALVSGFTAGNGHRGDLGALELSLWDPQERALVGIGKVGSGFTTKALNDMRERLAGNTPIVVEVEFLEVSPGGQLRMPVFKGVRQDIDPTTCTVQTLHSSA